MEIPRFYVKRPIEEICSQPCPLSPSFFLFFYLFIFFYLYRHPLPLVITRVFSIEFRRMREETTTPYRYAIKPGFNSIPRQRRRRYFLGGRRLILLSVLITPSNEYVNDTTEIVKLTTVSGILWQHVLRFYLGYTKIRNHKKSVSIPEEKFHSFRLKIWSRNISTLHSNGDSQESFNF